MEQNDVMLMVLQSLRDINTRLDGLEAGQKALQDEVKEIREDTRHTRVLLEATDKNVRILAESQLNLIEKIGKVEGMEATLEDVKSDTDVIKQVVTWHSDSIKKVL